MNKNNRFGFEVTNVVILDTDKRTWQKVRIIDFKDKQEYVDVLPIGEPDIKKTINVKTNRLTRVQY
jgi:hypothetical protein